MGALEQIPHFSYTVDCLDVETLPVECGRTATDKEGDRGIGAKTATAILRDGRGRLLNDRAEAAHLGVHRAW